MKKPYVKPELNLVKIDTTVSMCMDSGDPHHGGGHGGGHGHGHHHTARENAFGGSRPQNVSGFGESNSPW